MPGPREIRQNRGWNPRWRGFCTNLLYRIPLLSFTLEFGGAMSVRSIRVLGWSTATLDMQKLRPIALHLRINLNQLTR